jgi:hypothetical protein
LIPFIIDLMDKSKTHTIAFSDFWSKLKDSINGYSDDKKSNEYHTKEFGTIYRNSISNILQKLGVNSKRHNSFTELIFNHKKIMKNASQYNKSFQTKIDFEEGEGYEGCERSIEVDIVNNQMHSEDIRIINT